MSLSDAMTAVYSDLSKRADPNCKKCYGRGHIGRDVIRNALVVCPKCYRKWMAPKKGSTQNAEIY